MTMTKFVTLHTVHSPSWHSGHFGKNLKVVRSIFATFNNDINDINFLFSEAMSSWHSFFVLHQNPHSVATKPETSREQTKPKQNESDSKKNMQKKKYEKETSVEEPVLKNIPWEWKTSKTAGLTWYIFNNFTIIYCWKDKEKKNYH